MPSSTLSPVIRFIAIGAFALSLPGAAQGQSVPEWAVEHLDAWYTAFNAGDASGVARLYATDAVRLPPQRAKLRGRAAIEGALAENFQATRFECHGDYDHVRVMGGLAVAWGHDTCTETPQAGGSSETSMSRWLSVYEKRGTEWLIVYETWENVEP